MLGKSTHLQVIPQQSTKKNQSAITDMRQKPVDFFLLYNTGVNFSSRNNFAHLGSFAKICISAQSINSLPAPKSEKSYQILVPM